MMYVCTCVVREFKKCTDDRYRYYKCEFWRYDTRNKDSVTDVEREYGDGDYCEVSVCCDGNAWGYDGDTILYYCRSCADYPAS